MCVISLRSTRAGITPSGKPRQKRAPAAVPPQHGHPPPTRSWRRQQERGGSGPAETRDGARGQPALSHHSPTWAGTRAPPEKGHGRSEHPLPCPDSPSATGAFTGSIRETISARSVKEVVGEATF